MFADPVCIALARDISEWFLGQDTLHMSKIKRMIFKLLGEYVKKVHLSGIYEGKEQLLTVPKDAAEATLVAAVVVPIQVAH